MGLSKKEYNELADASDIGIRLEFRMNGIDYGFAGFGDFKDTNKTLKKLIHSLYATLCNKEKITKEQWDNWLNA